MFTCIVLSSAQSDVDVACCHRSKPVNNSNQTIVKANLRVRLFLSVAVVFTADIARRLLWLGLETGAGASKRLVGAEALIVNAIVSHAMLQQQRFHVSHKACRAEYVDVESVASR